MKAFKSVSIMMAIIIPVILIGYQNCSNLHSDDLTNQQINSPTFNPISLNSMAHLNYNQGSCVPELIEPHLFFNEASHLCITAVNSCQLSFLNANGFSIDDYSCTNAVPIDSSSLNGSFTDATPADFGYVADPNSMCTMQYQRLVNVKTRKCVNGANGCEISFLKTTHGFTPDSIGFCD